MENLLDEVDQLTLDLKRKKDKLNDVVSLIKEEMKDQYHNYNTATYFRYALMLAFGQYKKTYESEVVNDIKIYPVNEFKSNSYKNYYNILKADSWKFGCTENYRNAGFICYLKDLHCALDNNVYIKLWVYHIKRNNYKEEEEFEFLDADEKNQ
jgi:hypothetical protein